MPLLRLLFLLLLSMALMPSCSGDDDDDDDTSVDDDDVTSNDDDDTTDDRIHIETVPEGCNPLVPAECLYPYPSMTMMKEDASTPTGWQMDVQPDNIPLASASATTLASSFNRADGFSIGTPMLAYFDGAVPDDALLPGIDNLEDSVTADSPIQLFDMDTGERIPIWAEIDRLATDDADRALMIRQQVGLQPGHWHLVVITNDLKAEGGAALPVSDAYRALRDDLETDSEQVEAMRAEYDAIFEFLGGEGVERGDTVLAWRFMTFSDEFATGLVTSMLDKALNAADEFPYVIDYCNAADLAEEATFGCLPNDELHHTTWRRIFGHVTVPNFLNGEGLIEFDEDGSPKLIGTMQAEFVVNIPQSVKENLPGTAPLVVFGHGLLSDPANYIASDNDSNGMMALADKMGAIFFGTRWIGLSNQDIGLAASVAQDFGNSQKLSDRLAQGMINQNHMIRFMRQALASDPLLAAVGGGSLVHPTRQYYTGISQGGIFGTTFMAINPDIQTGILHVPTSMFSHVLQHSDLFASFQALIDMSVPDRTDQQILLAMAQRLFDPVDPINYARHLFTDTLTGLGAKNCLWQINWGDSSAPDFNGFALARTAGVPQVTPATQAIYGFDALAVPSAPGTSALMIFDPGLGRLPLHNDLGSETTSAHQATRRNDEVHDQDLMYFSEEAEGTVINPCPGACNVVPTPVEGKETYP